MKSTHKKFHEQNQFHVEKNQYTIFTFHEQNQFQVEKNQYTIFT